ncbi:hypothetical protein PV327_006049 [Microctonus hyperodae]|uniref:Death domain-containing protein n=1 Tax=Microctonus hyperodae TaxID=165561 RepID=A0AA39G2N4_MICHY|nr:hypothetical protein PV327_006049 [Microctonus hyperodae]
MCDLTRSSATKMKIPPPLCLHSDDTDMTMNHKSSRILKNDLLLHEAVIKNEPETVKKVLAETVDVNSRNNYGRAPIHWAASRGNTEIIDMLIHANCDIEARDKFGMRPLLMAAWYGHLDAVKMLITAGAEVSAISKKNYTLLMCAARGSRLVIEYLTMIVKSLNGEAIDSDGATALHHAAISGHPDVITALSIIPEIKLDATDKKGQTPLHCACFEGHADCAQVLIDLGANLNSRAIYGNSPLHVATCMRYTDIARTLLKAGADTQTVNDAGLTALHVAASQGCKGILESILQYSNKIINKQCHAGNTPLHLACQNNEVETVEILIKHGADLNCLNAKLQMPIHIAAEMGHTDICKLLLASGANIEQREKGGQTPLYIAARGSFTAIVDMIIKTARLEYPPNEKNNVEELLPVKKWPQAHGSSKNSIRCHSTISDELHSILMRLAHKQLDKSDWKKLAQHWAFTHDQIQAIEHQYTGPSSYKEHGYRLLMIWTSNLSADIVIVRELYDALCAIDKKNVADAIRTQLEKDVNNVDDVDDDSKSTKRRCDKCNIS